MFQRIVVIYGESLESRRALTSAIQLAKAFQAELYAVSFPLTQPMPRPPIHRLVAY
jgi:hypothetical protein